MTKRPDDDAPEPPGGRAAERLREFMEQRFPQGAPADADACGEGEQEQPADGEQGPAGSGGGDAGRVTGP